MKFCVKVETDIKTGKTDYRFGGKNEAILWSRLCGYKRIFKIRCGIGYIHGKEINSASVGNSHRGCFTCSRKIIWMRTEKIKFFLLFSIEIRIFDRNKKSERLSYSESVRIIRMWSE